MLEPDTRELLLDALRPPDDHELVHAVGTSYSLDLHALMFAPLTFALFDWAIENGRPNPIALLEALRRHADRVTMFCQAGQIGIPTDHQPLLTYLEQCVVGVTPPNPEYIFHPKLWVLRFAPADGGDDHYRVLCLTRNLTFDTSWDTITVLDGERRAGGDTIAQNRSLVSFLEGLVELAPALPEARRTAIGELAEGIADVRFAAPEGFDSVRFHPLGIGDGGWPFRSGVRRLLVVSPFLTGGTLGRLLDTGAADSVLISRQEMLDDLGSDAIQAWDRTFIVNQNAVQPDALQLVDTEMDPEGDSGRALTDEATGDAVDSGLQGLHAKLFVAEHDRDVRFYTGSANATDAAFGGNVEFLVEMRTGQEGVGIDALLDEESKTTTFRHLLIEHEPDNAEPRESSDAEKVDRSLDRARRRIGALDFEAHLSPNTEDSYLLELRGTGRLDLPDEVTTIHCWPLTRKQAHQMTARLDTDGLEARFGHITETGITSFFGFEVHASRRSASDYVRFAVNARLIGAPEGRAEKVILQILETREHLLRFLLFLLADTTGGYADLMDQLTSIGTSTKQRRAALFEDPPLFETLLRAITRDPKRLDHIAGLLADLRESGRAEELLPEGFEELWEPIWAIRQEQAG